MAPVPSYDAPLPASSQSTIPSRTTEPFSMIPSPSMDPTVSSKLLRLKIPLVLTISRVVSGMTSAAPSMRIPPLTIVLPVYV